jgi:hypothetical protein
MALVVDLVPASRRGADRGGGGRVTRRRYLGSWALPSANSCDVYLGAGGQLALEWDDPPSPSWPRADVEHYRNITFPEILRAVATATGQSVLGVQG